MGLFALNAIARSRLHSIRDGIPKSHVGLVVIMTPDVVGVGLRFYTPQLLLLLLFFYFFFFFVFLIPQVVKKPGVKN